MVTQPTVRRLAGTVAFTLAVLAAVAETTTPAGPAVRLDAFTTTAHQVDRLRAHGSEPVCVLPVTRWEPHRPDANRFPDELLGAPVGDGTGSRWLLVQAWPQLAPLVADRLRLCREKGMSQVSVGPLLPPGDADNVEYVGGLSGLAHDLNLTIVDLPVD